MNTTNKEKIKQTLRECLLLHSLKLARIGTIFIVKTFLYRDVTLL